MHRQGGVALAVRKRGRRCVVAKVVTPARGERVLAIPYRHRARLASGEVSLPPAVLRRAQEEGAQALIVRDDTEWRAWRLPLAEVWRLGRRGRDGEVYLPLAAMEEIPPPRWPYVERVELVDAQLSFDDLAGA